MDQHEEVNDEIIRNEVHEKGCDEGHEEEGREQNCTRQAGKGFSLQGQQGENRIRPCQNRSHEEQTRQGRVEVVECRWQ